MFLSTVDGVLMVLPGSWRGAGVSGGPVTHSRTFGNPGMLPLAAGNASARGFFHESGVTVRLVLAVANNQIMATYNVLYLEAPVL